jgi:hypothetical protein
MLNAPRIRDFAVMLADLVGPVVARGTFPVVLGGDCSIVLGPLLALRRTGRRHGLLFLDGHADFYQPQASPTGEAADMDLALATGRGPDIVADIEGLKPLVRDEDVAVLGYRDSAEAAANGSQPLPPSIHAQDLATLRRKGAGAAVRESLAHLARPDLDGFWIHLLAQRPRARDDDFDLQPGPRPGRQDRPQRGGKPGPRLGALARCAAGIVRATAKADGSRICSGALRVSRNNSAVMVVLGTTIHEFRRAGRDGSMKTRGWSD